MYLQKICEKLGKNNSAVYTVVAVAVFKGIFRPFFTMNDKKQNPESKKYAAIREGATEIIAIPTYIGLAKLTEKFDPKFALDKSVKGNFTSPKSALHFLGVCAAALLVIPGLCSMAMPGILKLFGKKDKKPNQQTVLNNQVQKLDVVSVSNKPAAVANPIKKDSGESNLLLRYKTTTSGGMKI